MIHAWYWLPYMRQANNNLRCTTVGKNKNSFRCQNKIAVQKYRIIFLAATFLRFTEKKPQSYFLTEKAFQVFWIRQAGYESSAVGSHFWHKVRVQGQFVVFWFPNNAWNTQRTNWNIFVFCFQCKKFKMMDLKFWDGVTVLPWSFRKSNNYLVREERMISLYWSGFHVKWMFCEIFQWIWVAEKSFGLGYWGSKSHTPLFCTNMWESFCVEGKNKLCGFEGNWLQTMPMVLKKQCCLFEVGWWVKESDFKITFQQKSFSELTILCLLGIFYSFFYVNTWHTTRVCGVLTFWYWVPTNQTMLSRVVVRGLGVCARRTNQWPDSLQNKKPKIFPLMFLVWQVICTLDGSNSFGSCHFQLQKKLMSSAVHNFILCIEHNLLLLVRFLAFHRILGCQVFVPATLVSTVRARSE